MPKKTARKTAKRVVAKKPVRKVSRSVRSISRSSSKGFFEKHKNLKWIIPLFVVLLFGLLLLNHSVGESPTDDNGTGIKAQVRNMLHMPQDSDSSRMMQVSPTGTDNSTITPYVTVAPTGSSVQGY
ncbi:MAG TPA: hypothetical protein VF189_02635 [Patescibacteria group bacterium]